MDSFWDLFKPDELIAYGGLFLLLLIVFVENGMFFGFFLPGDSLLFTAGLLAYTGVLEVEIVNLIIYIALAATAGYYVGYWFGHKTGQALYNKEDTIFFKKKYIYTAEQFYKKYGGVTLIVGRFLPIIRTFAPILAGVVSVKQHIFFLYTIIGAFLWPGVVVTSGYYVGHFIPNAQEYLHWIIVAFVVVTAIPVLNTWRAERKKRKQSVEQTT
ncbi:MAG: DedA family protein [Bacteroidia bacterium]